MTSFIIGLLIGAIGGFALSIVLRRAGVMK